MAHLAPKQQAPFGLAHIPGVKERDRKMFDKFAEEVNFLYLPHIVHKNMDANNLLVTHCAPRTPIIVESLDETKRQEVLAELKHPDAEYKAWGLAKCRKALTHLATRAKDAHAKARITTNRGSASDGSNVCVHLYSSSKHLVSALSVRQVVLSAVVAGSHCLQTAAAAWHCGERSWRPNDCECTCQHTVPRCPVVHARVPGCGFSSLRQYPASGSSTLVLSPYNNH